MTEVKEKLENKHSFSCENCGGVASFSPEDGVLKCEYCGWKKDLISNDQEIKEYDFNDAHPSENWGVEMTPYACMVCGGEIVVENTVTATVCAYCGASQIYPQKKEGMIAPESLIPFQISKKQVQELFKKWLASRRFAPSALSQEARGSGILGIYLPHWTYDSHTSTNYSCEVGHYYEETETYTEEENGKQVTKTRKVQKVRWSKASGYLEEFFDDVLVIASRKQMCSKIYGIYPFDFRALVPYRPEYLSGFMAERYQLSLKEGFDSAKNSMKFDIERLIEKKEKQHADLVRDIQARTTFSDVKFKLILLPLWISSYTYQNKVYQYLVNGQTGSVSGEAPVSFWKITALVLFIVLGVLIVGGSVYFYSQG